jgi:hypothetical protein
MKRHPRYHRHQSPDPADLIFCTLVALALFFFLFFMLNL